MFDFLKNMWVMKRIDKDYLQLRADKKQITQAEYLQIIAIEQIN